MVLDFWDPTSSKRWSAAASRQLLYLAVAYPYQQKQYRVFSITLAIFKTKPSFVTASLRHVIPFLFIFMEDMPDSYS